MAKYLNWAADDQVGFSDGQVVASLAPDLGSTALVQPTSTYQPLYKVNQMGGLPGILFDGVDDQLTCTIPNNLAISRYVVYHYLGAGTGDGGFPRLWDGYGYGLYINRSNGQLIFRDWRGSINGDFRTPTGLVTGAMDFEVDVHYDRTVDTNLPDIWFNGVQQTVTLVTAPSGVKSSEATLWVGNNATNAPPHTKSMHGALCELGLSNTKDSLSVAAAERSRLLTKWGLSSASHFQQSVAGTMVMTGTLPVLEVDIVPPQGGLAMSGDVTAVRSTPAPIQLVVGEQDLSGTVRKKISRKLSGSLGLGALITAQLPSGFTQDTDGLIGMSGELVGIVVQTRHSDCIECTKRNIIRQSRHDHRRCT